MNYLPILAQAAGRVEEDVQVVPIDFIWEQITALSWLQAILAISFGVVYLMYGWRLYTYWVRKYFDDLGAAGERLPTPQDRTLDALLRPERLLELVYRWLPGLQLLL